MIAFDFQMKVPPCLVKDFNLHRKQFRVRRYKTHLSLYGQTKSQKVGDWYDPYEHLLFLFRSEIVQATWCTSTWKGSL